MGMILWAYDEAIMRLEQARHALILQDTSTAFPFLLRAQFLVHGLARSVELKPGDRLSQNLLRLYEFTLYCLSSNSVDKIAAALRVLTILREGFREAQAKTPTSVRSEELPPLEPLHFLQISV